MRLSGDLRRPALWLGRGARAAARLWSNRSLVVQLVRREVAARYRGSVLGILWALLTPLFLLAVFTFVFGTVFQSRWTAPDASRGTASGATIDFAIILFAGLIVFQIFAEVVGRAPGLVVANPSYVKKVVFPLEILPVVAVGSALFHAAIALGVLVAFELIARGGIPLTALLLPLVLAPYVLQILGVAWLLASVGVYYRDVSQFLGVLITALMFLSPIFYPIAALPDWLQPWVAASPIAWPVEETRNVLILGGVPRLDSWLLYTAVSLVVAALGYLWFQKTRKGFADVL